MKLDTRRWNGSCTLAAEVNRSRSRFRLRFRFRVRFGFGCLFFPLPLDRWPSGFVYPYRNQCCNWFTPKVPRRQSFGQRKAFHVADRLSRSNPVASAFCIPPRNPHQSHEPHCLPPLDLSRFSSHCFKGTCRLLTWLYARLSLTTNPFRTIATPEIG